MKIGTYPKIYLYKRIVQAKVFIDKHYAEKIDLGNISDEAWFSKFHFIRLFKSIYGKTPHQYLVTVRIKEAEQHLRNGSSVKDACFEVGFDSLTSFSGLFKKITGKTPSQYAGYWRQKQQLAAADPLSLVPGCYAWLHGWEKE